MNPSDPPLSLTGTHHDLHPFGMLCQIQVLQAHVASADLRAVGCIHTNPCLSLACISISAVCLAVTSLLINP